MRTYGPAHLSFNTYLSSFYESYWIKHTNIAEVELSITGEGRLWCNIFREAANGGCSLIGRHLIELSPGGSNQIHLPFQLVQQGHGHGGRIFTDLELLTATKISAMSWCTQQKPRQEVSLGIGICTFNREPFVARTVGNLLSAPQEAGVVSVAVVNQGRALTRDFAALTRTAGARLSVYQQANFGGAGGFTRSAIELLKDRSITHILFMDDDIELDARHLVTTAAFLRFARKPVVVGGHMLDLYRRFMLYEAGNSISPDNQLRPNHHNRDLYELTSLSALSRVASSHFNGWWYAAIPASCFRDFGLPAPIFIRGDDLEYGTRLHRAGVETVSLPPVSVWHEPFYAKPPGWQLYYDLRNRLIFASLYDDAFALDTPERLLKLLMVHMIRYDYQQAWFMMTALEDFLKGPALMDEGLPAIHERVTLDAGAYAPERLSAALGLEAAPADLPTRPAAIRRRMLTSLARVLAGRPRRGSYGVQYTDTPLQWVRLGPSYVLSDREGHFFLRFGYSRAHTWRLTRLAARTIRRYRKQRRSAAQAWKADFPRLVSHESWHMILGLEDVSSKPQAGEGGATVTAS